MASMASQEIEDFLAEPRDAVLSVVLGSGRAMGTPIWFRMDCGLVRFQSPTTSAKTAALRDGGRASLCVHDQPLPLARYVTLEGPVVEVDFDFDRDIGEGAVHYLGENAPPFLDKIRAAIASGRRWASFEMTPTTVLSGSQSLL